jgi:hypothetical protein
LWEREQAANEEAKKAKKAKKAGSGGRPTDYLHEYNDLDEDVLGSGSDSDDDQWSNMPMRGKGAKGKKKKGEEEDKDNGSYMLFDFRRGPGQWPNCVEVIDAEKGAEMTEKAKEEILKKGKKGKGGDDGAFFTDSSSDDDFGSDDEETMESTAPPDAEFETLRDGSTAYVLPPGCRIKLNLSDILKGGDAKKEERKKEAAKKKKRKDKGGGGIPGFFGGAGGIVMGGGMGGKYAKKWKEYVNVYTITMDLKVCLDPHKLTSDCAVLVSCRF